MPADSSRKRRQSLMRTFALAMELPFVLVAGVVIGGGAGYWLDAKLGSSPLLTFLLGIIGFAAGVREVLRRIPKEEPPGGNGDGGDGGDTDSNGGDGGNGGNGDGGNGDGGE